MDLDGKLLKVVKLDDAAPEAKRGKGRPKALKYPPLPQAILDAMTPLEQEHFSFFVESTIKATRAQSAADLEPLDLLCIHMAGLEYVNLLRVQASQLDSGQVMSMARQHPGVQMRQWLDQLSVSRNRRPSKKTEVDPVADALMRMSS